ncbi:hypothetical protein BYT27DRAFT_7260861 [Phlegmacium glaucopus]|nr:hypothetical protein BYT27DRAFT_7260861 [Phlegmacium glaucopus]
MFDPSGSGHAIPTPTVDQSRPDNTEDHSMQSASPTRPSDSSTENERLKLLTDLKFSVESFRKGSITKTEAISSILLILGENPHKLIKYDMPWFNPNEESAADIIHPSSQETRQLLQVYHGDIAKAKFYAKIAPNSPTGIPSSQWEHIFRGDSVNLNQILTSLHHTVVDEERKGRLGDAEVSLGFPEAKKHVRTASEWLTAWRRASKTISFMFPNRQDELLDYGDYIEEEFAAKLHSSHHQIILYDIALRNEVGTGQHILLMEMHHFSWLYSTIVMPDRIESHPTSSFTRKMNNNTSSTRKPEICNKFNSSDVTAQRLLRKGVFSRL